MHEQDRYAANLAAMPNVQAFDGKPHLNLLNEMFLNVYATHKRHQKSNPFCDHVIAFSVADGRIWIRNYQVCLHGPALLVFYFLTSMEARFYLTDWHDDS